jgi:PAS domain S-box-containing protein
VTILSFFKRLFSTDFLPHVYCLRDPALIGLHAVSDGLTALAYFVIPVLLIVIMARRRDLAFRWAFVLFGVFILACGGTHVLGIVTLWIPVYRLDGLVKAITAIASVGTAIALVRVMPEIEAQPTAEQLRHEIAERVRAEAEVRRLNSELEKRVSERTGELETANSHLAEFAATLDYAQIIVQDFSGKIVFWNSGSETLYGWTRAEAVGQDTHELLKTELPLPYSEIQRILLRDGNWSGEVLQRARDGSALWVASYWALRRDEAGKPVSIVRVNNDITALKRVDEALRKSEATTRSLFENAGQGIVTVNSGGLIVNANAMAQRLFGYGADELIGMTVDALLPENARQRHGRHREAFVREPHARPMGQGLELVGQRRDGSEFPVEISLSYVAEGYDRVLSIAFISDITARQRASREREELIAQLKTALGEKTVLLKEVHHRVKNNLAVIAGLLAMQAENLEDERAITSLGESERRVMSMALIHEFLYANDNLDRVDFGTYVEQLSGELYASYAIEPDLVGFDTETEKIDLPINMAVPCALILNELLSNALKYAFPGGRSGTILVRFARTGDTELALSCEDNGVGIPEGFDWENPKSLGLRIIAILTKQVDGRMLRRTGHAGTKFELQFPG